MSDNESLDDRIAAYIKAQWNQAELYGWSCIHVLPGIGAGFTYSLGFNKNWRHPDFIFFGLRPEVAQQLIGDLYSQVIAGRRYETPSIVNDLIRDYNAFMIEVTPTNVTEYARALAIDPADSPPLIQVVLPDVEGRFPWSPGYAQSDLQPIIGKVPVRQ